MNKTIMFLGMLAAGFANAQQTNNYDGKVGVNTDQPSATLNVKSKTGTNTSTKNFELENANGTKMLTVLDNGRVGINNPSPSYLLDLTAIGKGYGDNSIAIRGYRNKGSIKMGLDFYRAVGTVDTPLSVSKGDGIANIGFSPYNGTKYIGAAEISTIVTGDVTGSEAPVSIDFKTKIEGSETKQTVLRVHHSGNVGIGTEDPKNKLHVKATENPLRLDGLRPATAGANTYNLVVEDGVVKIGGIANTNAGNTDSEWNYDANTNRIKLKRSGQGTMKNSIFYDANTGQYVDIDDENNIRNIIFNFNKTNGISTFEEIRQTLSQDAKYKNFIHSESENLHSSISRNSVGEETTYKQLEKQTIVVTETDKTDRFYTNVSNIIVPPKNTNNFVAVYGDRVEMDLVGTGTVSNSLAQQGQVVIANSQKVTGYITGLLGANVIETSGTIGQAYGVYGRNFFGSSTGATVTRAASGYFQSYMTGVDNSLIREHLGILSTVSNNSQNPATGDYIAGIRSIVTQEGKTKYPNMYGIYAQSSIKKGAVAPDNNYGIFVNHITGGAVSNYAIYTLKGKVHLGDEVEVKSTIKVADNTADNTCTTEKAGTIRFDATAKKFQGCTGDNWVDLHN